jgi:hypothetical protein
MDDTNPRGSAKTVGEAAASFMNILDPQEAQAQPDGQEDREQEPVAEYQADDSQEYEEGDEASEPTPTYRVKVDKEEIEVPLDELLKGYSRTADYTKKTQELAETRKAVEAERQRIQEANQLRDVYAERLKVIEQMLNQGQTTEDLSALKETDPMGYAIKVAEMTEREKQISAVRAERQKIEQQQQAQYAEALKAHLASESEKLAAAIPELADKAKGEAIRAEIREYAKGLGYTDQDIQGIYDHRVVSQLYKSMKYEQLMSGKTQATKKVTEAPRMMRPGTSTPEARETQEMKKLREQVRRSGKKGDAARLFERFL